MKNITILVSQAEGQESSLLHTCQGTYVEMFAATAGQTESDDMYKTMVFLMWEVAKQLKLRVR